MTHSTHTRTHTKLHAWAETTPHTCPPGCAKRHAHADDPCAVTSCGEPLLAGETCYAATELNRDADGREPWVCWRHIRPDEGPLR